MLHQSYHKTPVRQGSQLTSSWIQVYDMLAPSWISTYNTVDNSTLLSTHKSRRLLSHVQSATQAISLSAPHMTHGAGGAEQPKYRLFAPHSAELSPIY